MTSFFDVKSSNTYVLFCDFSAQVHLKWDDWNKKSSLKFFSVPYSITNSFDSFYFIKIGGGITDCTIFIWATVGKKIDGTSKLLFVLSSVCPKYVSLLGRVPIFSSNMNLSPQFVQHSWQDLSTVLVLNKQLTAPVPCMNNNQTGRCAHKNDVSWEDASLTFFRNVQEQEGTHGQTICSYSVIFCGSIFNLLV